MEKTFGGMVNSPECCEWSEVSDPVMSGGADDKVIREETSAGPETDLCGLGLRQSNHNKGLMVVINYYHVSSVTRLKIDAICSIRL